MELEGKISVIAPPRVKFPLRLWRGGGGRGGGGGGGGREGTRSSKAAIQHGSDITGEQWDLTEEQ